MATMEEPNFCAMHYPYCCDLRAHQKAYISTQCPKRCTCDRRRVRLKNPWALGLCRNVVGSRLRDRRLVTHPCGKFVLLVSRPRS